MWDRITNYVTGFVRDLQSTYFIIIASILAVLGFYFLALFLKANKKEAPKVNKISYLLTSILMIVLFVVLVRLRN